MKLIKIKDKYYITKVKDDIDMRGIKTEVSLERVKGGSRTQKMIDKIVEIGKKYNITIKQLRPPTDIAPAFYLYFKTDDESIAYKFYNEITKGRQYPQFRKHSRGNYQIIFY